MLSELPAAWSLQSLGSFCSPKQHPTVSKNKLTKSGYPVYGANGQIGFYSAYTHESRTIAITCRGATCGTINLVPPKAYITGNAMALDNLDESKADFDFLSHSLVHFGVHECITGSAQPQITRAALLPFNVVLPPLFEQKRIAKILSSVDESIQATQAVIEQAESVKQAFAASVVVGQNPYFQPLKHGSITELCDINPRQKMTKGNVYAFVDMASLPINNSSEIRYATKQLGSGGAKFQNGDTLFARITPCTENGKLGFVSELEESELAFGSTEFTVLRPRFAAKKLAYIYCYAGGLRKHLITRMVGSTGRQRVPNEAFTEYDVAYYDEKSQLGIIALFNELESAQKKNKKLLIGLERIKQGLMDDLLTGKVRTV